MTKQARNTGKRARRDQRNQYAQHAQDAQYGTRSQRIALPGDSLQVPVVRTPKATKPWVYLNEAQHALGNAITVYPITFAVGEFGTGKTFVPAAMAADAFLAGLIDKIIITRPAVGCDEEHGFLPGDLDEKVAPWAQPVIDVLNERMGASYVEYLIKVKTIEIAPLGMLRGRTFSNAFVMLDEAQNTTPKQMKLFLSRIGEGTKMVVDGDLEQKDIPGPSGLADAIARFRDHPQFGYVEFGVEDIVRSGIAKEICYGYSARYQREREQMIAASAAAPAFLAASIPA